MKYCPQTYFDFLVKLSQNLGKTRYRVTFYIPSMYQSYSLPQELTGLKVHYGKPESI